MQSIGFIARSFHYILFSRVQSNRTYFRLPSLNCINSLQRAKCMKKTGIC